MASSFIVTDLWWDGEQVRYEDTKWLVFSSDQAKRWLMGGRSITHVKDVGATTPTALLLTERQRDQPGSARTPILIIRTKMLPDADGCQ